MDSNWFEWVMANQERMFQILALVLALVATLAQRKEKVQRLGTELMLGAEKLGKTTLLSSGSEKMEYVVDNIVDRLPADVKSYLELLAKVQGKSLEELAQELSQGWYDLALSDIAH